MRAALIWSGNVRLCSAILVAAIAATYGSTAHSADCASDVTRDTVAPCAVRASPAVRGEQQVEQALDARRTAVSPLLPSNPILSVSAARRVGAGTEAYNWYAALSQEIEIAGQRGARRRAAETELAAQGQRVTVTQRDVAAGAYVAYFEALAAEEEKRLAARLEAIAGHVAKVARAMADKGLLAPVDADVADAAALRATQARLAAERSAHLQRVTLATFLGVSPASPPNVRGDLVPLREASAAVTLEARPEVQTSLLESRAMQERADAFRRARIPNISLSIFAQNDGFNERVLGVGLMLPIPLPYPVGRTYAGEIAESEALGRRATTDADRARREIGLAFAVAQQAYASRKTEVAAFTPERLQRADQGLASIAREIESGRLVVRDAVIAQQALIDLLRAHVEARRALCLASVDLARAAGVPLERGAR
jgi:cobalt-zinc-cadmium efflux system outer membrane protein